MTKILELLFLCLSHVALRRKRGFILLYRNTVAGTRVVLDLKSAEKRGLVFIDSLDLGHVAFVLLFSRLLMNDEPSSPTLVIGFWLMDHLQRLNIKLSVQIVSGFRMLSLKDFHHRVVRNESLRSD
jgi:hypothetical protein